MKKIAITVTILILMISCSSDNTSTNTSGVVKVDFDGQTWESEETRASILSSISSIFGIKNNGQSLVISIREGIDIGTYEVATDLNVTIAYTPEPGLTSFTSDYDSENAGEVNITAINFDTKLVSGNFNFIGQRLVDDGTGNLEEEFKEFTNGVFTDIPFLTELESDGDNFLMTKIDGENYVADSVSGMLFTIIDKIQINALRNELDEGITLILDPNITVGNHIINGIGGNNYGSYTIGSLSSNDPPLTTHTINDSGFINITTHDLENKLIEGTFEFDLEAIVGSEFNEFREGSFSVAY